MTETADVERAERLARRRSRILAVQAILFLSWQSVFVAGQSEERMRAVTQVKISAWLVWSIALLVLLATGGGLLRGHKVRTLLNDELTRSHRAKAYVYGFWAAMGAAIGLYAVDMFDPVSAREAIHIVMTAGIGTSLLLFAMLDRRSRAEA